MKFCNRFGGLCLSLYTLYVFSISGAILFGSRVIYNTIEYRVTQMRVYSNLDENPKKELIIGKYSNKTRKTILDDNIDYVLEAWFLDESKIYANPKKIVSFSRKPKNLQFIDIDNDALDDLVFELSSTANMKPL